MHVTPASLPPRVLHVTQPVDGGVARVVADLVRLQRAAGMRVAVACPPAGALPALLDAAGCEVLDWAAVRSPARGVRDEVRRLSELVTRTAPELIHAHSAKAGLVTRLAVRGRVPTVFQPHAWSFEAVGGPAARLALNWERFGARWTTRLICVSRAERDHGRRRGVRGPVSLVPNGVDLGLFHPGTGTEPAPEGLPEGDGPLVVCVGRLCRQKGQDVLVKAWHEVGRQVPGARLVLVGDGPDTARLRAAAPPGVTFTGAVADPTAWYRAADLVVLPSRWEGMALAPLEAMACGSPVLLTDVDGARESLPPGRAAGCLVPPGRPEALARALARLLADPGKLAALGASAHRHVREHHDVRHTAAAVADVYRDLLEPVRSSPSAPRRPARPLDAREAGTGGSAT
ncbi:glycosyltransferase family 4 protein [Streptomyces sp. NPDC050145]|uniref:glycosyltransferase family 4 protein n=1 Tax=Streptomyces sp. NPDC050145 TaxID=3365602 RepID=UPI0037A62310